VPSWQVAGSLLVVAFAMGVGYGSAETIDLYVVPSGCPHDSASATSSIHNLVCDSFGRLLTTNLGTFAPGDYDIWVDRNGNEAHDTDEPMAVFTVSASGLPAIPLYPAVAVPAAILVLMATIWRRRNDGERTYMAQLR